MEIIYNIISRMVTKIKENEELKDIRFLKAFDNNYGQNPFDDYIVTVDLKKLTQGQTFVGGYFDSNSKGQLYSGKIVFRVYSDREKSGENLGNITMKIYNQLLSSDDNGIISNSNISPITYDSDFEAIYREIAIEVEFCLCGDS